MLEHMLHSNIEKESRMANNHGVYYDTTILALALLEGSVQSMYIAQHVKVGNEC